MGSSFLTKLALGTVLLISAIHAASAQGTAALTVGTFPSVRAPARRSSNLSCTSSNQVDYTGGTFFSESHLRCSGTSCVTEMMNLFTTQLRENQVSTRRGLRGTAESSWSSTNKHMKHGNISHDEELDIQTTLARVVRRAPPPPPNGTPGRQPYVAPPTPPTTFCVNCRKLFQHPEPR